MGPLRNKYTQDLLQIYAEVEVTKPLVVLGPSITLVVRV